MSDNMEIMQGDAFNVAMTLTDKQGNVIPPDVVDEILASIGAIVKRYTLGEVQYDANDGIWYFPVAQSETRGMLGIAPFDLRVKFTTGDVKGRRIGFVSVLSTGANEVL